MKCTKWFAAAASLTAWFEQYEPPVTQSGSLTNQKGGGLILDSILLLISESVPDGQFATLYEHLCH